MARKEEDKYIYMENVLKDINTHCISLDKKEKRRNNIILDEVLTQIIEVMKEKNTIFREIFRGMYYGGSYYDGLKVEKPNEYDLDLLLDLPALTGPQVSASHIPGYVQIRITNLKEYEIQPYAIPNLARRLLDEENYLSIEKVQRWMESIINIALNEFLDGPSNFRIIRTVHCGLFYCKLRKGGPAFTLNLQGVVDRKDVNIDVDLVPCFVFTDRQWPGHPYRTNPAEEMNEFFVVPKKADSSNTGDLSKYWRMSFQDQEGFLIKDLQFLKPVLRFLKRLRDVQNHKIISSYYIKTIFLWEIEEHLTDFWKKPMSYILMKMLKKYQQYIKQGQIPYYWNEWNNLLQKANPDTLFNFANNIQAIINDIEKHPEDPYRIAKHMNVVFTFDEDEEPHFLEEPNAVVAREDPENPCVLL